MPDIRLSLVAKSLELGYPWRVQDLSEMLKREFPDLNNVQQVMVTEVGVPARSHVRVTFMPEVSEERIRQIAKHASFH